MITDIIVIFFTERPRDVRWGKELRSEYTPLDHVADHRVAKWLKIWRRGWDLNPRYPLRYVRFRGGSFQPLTHLSAPCTKSLGKHRSSLSIIPLSLCAGA